MISSYFTRKLATITGLRARRELQRTRRGEVTKGSYVRSSERSERGSFRRDNVDGRHF